MNFGVGKVVKVKMEGKVGRLGRDLGFFELMICIPSEVGRKAEEAQEMVKVTVNFDRKELI